jgi:hypothetical protein
VLPLGLDARSAMNLGLSDQETAALTQELHDIVESDRYPFSPRIRTLRTILVKLRPEAVREPLPPPKVYAPEGDGFSPALSHAVGSKAPAKSDAIKREMMKTLTDTPRSPGLQARLSAPSGHHGNGFKRNHHAELKRCVEGSDRRRGPAAVDRPVSVVRAAF